MLQFLWVRNPRASQLGTSDLGVSHRLPSRYQRCCSCLQAPQEEDHSCDGKPTWDPRWLLAGDFSSLFHGPLRTVYNMAAIFLTVKDGSHSLFKPKLTNDVPSYWSFFFFFIRIELFHTRSILYQEERDSMRAGRPVGDRWLSQKLPITITKYASRIQDGRGGEPGSLGKGS